MSDISLVDTTIHIDKDTDADTRTKIDEALRKVQGVMAVAMHDDKPHLIVIEYDPDKTSAKSLLIVVKELAGHAELIGL
jgi:hypothetical protein